MSRRAAIVEEEFDDDTDLPLPSQPLPNIGSRGPVLQEVTAMTTRTIVITLNPRSKRVLRRSHPNHGLNPILRIPARQSGRTP
jgi:hypothetical protein